jgi:signal peptidase I
MKIIKRVAIILAGLIGLYYLAFGAFYVAGYRVYRTPTFAMQPTVQKGEKVVGRLSEGYRDRIQRFDIVLFYTAQAPGEIYMKRVVGLSGEHITIDESGVKIDGQKLIIPTAVNSAGLGLKKCDVIVPNDAVFLLGDHTPNSLDSRYLGPIPKKDVIGYLIFKK